MANYLVSDTELTAIADSIRAKKGTSSPIPFLDFSNEIESISDDSPIKLDATWKNNDSTSAYGEIFLTAKSAEYSGNYNIAWADDYITLSDYLPFAVLSLDVANGKVMDSVKLIEFNAIPEHATRICAVKNGAITCAYNIPSYKKWNSNEFGPLLYRNIVNSDSHYNYETAASDIQGMLEFAENDEETVAAVSAGDLTANGYISELNGWKSLRDTYRGNKPVYCCSGNHEAASQNAIMYTNPSALREFLDTDWTDETETYFLKEIENDIYIFLSVFEGTTQGVKNTMFTTAELNWLEEKLELYRNQRVFLFAHIPPIWNNSGLKKNGNYSGFALGNGAYTLDLWGTSKTDRNTFLNLLDHYKNVIWFSGHTHIKYQYQSVWDYLNVWQYKGGARFVHVSSLTVPRDIVDGSTTGLIYAEGEFSVMDVYANAIRLKSYNLIEGKYYGACEYIIDTTPVTIPPNSKTVVSISAVKTKTSYYTDETLSTGDITVTALYSDGTTEDVSSSAIYDTANVQISTPGTYTIGINYTYGGITVSTSVQVSSVERPSVKTLASISAVKTKTAYMVNEVLSTADIEVTALYSDGTTANVTSAAQFDTSDVDMATAGAYTIGIEYTEDGVTANTMLGVTVSTDTGGYTVVFDAEWQGQISTKGGSVDGSAITPMLSGITVSGANATVEPGAAALSKPLYYRLLSNGGIDSNTKVGFGIGIGNASSKFYKQASPFYSFTSATWQPLTDGTNALELTSSHPLLSAVCKSSSTATATFPVTINARIQIGYSNS